VLLDEQTLEEEFGWVFFYQSSAFIRSGRTADMFAGNAPIAVSRVSGEVRVTGTSHPIEHYLEELRRDWT
jgi:hypothetical protein